MQTAQSLPDVRDATLLNPSDNVAIALRDLKAGDAVKLSIGSSTVVIRLLNDIPFGHKFAVRDIPMCGLVVKYGHVIGRAKRDISYCAPCDAPLFKDKVVAVVGGGDSAASAALLLTEYATKVYMIHRRDKLRAQPIYQELLLKNNKITIIWNTVVKELKGDKVLKSAVLQRVDTGQITELPIDGIFVEIGAEPPINFFKSMGLELDGNGYIVVNHMMETSVKGIYAAGDCVSLTPRGFRQIIVAAAQGALAAYSAYNYILTKYGQNREK